MSIKVIEDVFRRKQKEIETYVKEEFPRKAGKVALDHFRENFDKEGYVDGGLHKWKEPKRKHKRGKAATRYKTLHSGRNNLRDSLRSRVEGGKAIIHTDVEYAYIHNYGGTINHPITRKQRVKAMETHIRRTGTQHRTKNSIWKGLALTPRTSYTIKMPQRRFIGPGRELKEKLQKMAEKDINNLLNK